MDWIKKSGSVLSMGVLLWVVVSCTISYQFNGASINYDKVKTITIGLFPITSPYVYGPLATTFNEGLNDIFVRQTRLQQVSRNGDLNIEGEIVGYDQFNQSVQADGYSSETQLKLTVNVRFTNNTDHTQDFEQQFSAFRNFPSTSLLTTVQDPLIAEMVKEITEQIFNATVANW